MRNNAMKRDRNYTAVHAALTAHRKVQRMRWWGELGMSFVGALCVLGFIVMMAR